MLLPTPPKELNGQPQSRVFYGRELAYNHKNHQYRWGGQHVPSVTTIQGRLNKQALLKWYADCAVDHILDRVRDTAGVKQETFEVICDEARDAATKKRDEAGSLGTSVHDYCTAVLAAKHQLPLPDDPKIKPMCEGFLEWFSEHEVHAIDVERMIMSEHMMYAGRTDMYGRIDGQLGVMDLKTGNIINRATQSPYPDVWLQLTGYEIALCEELHINEPTWRFCLHLDKKSGKPSFFRKPQSKLHVETWCALTILDKKLREMDRKAAA